MVALVAIALLLTRKPSSSSGQAGASEQSLLLYCAASNRAVIESIRDEYEKEFNRNIEIQYGPSQTLLSSVEVTRAGDLYLPADDSYLKIAADKELTAETLPIARMQAVIVVPKGNPKGIEKFSDLLKSDIRLVQANPDTAAVGKIVRKVLTKSQQWEQLEKATTAFRATVTEVANDVAVGAAVGARSAQVGAG